MKKHFYTTLLLTVLFCTTIIGQKRLLWIGDETRAEDKPIVDFLKADGYTVTSVTGGTFNTAPYATAAGYENYDAIYFSELSGSSDLNNFKTAGFPIPSVVNKGHVAKTGKWDLVADNDAQLFDPDAGTITDDIKSFIITDNTHYITSVFESNQDIVWTTIENKDEARAMGANLSENIDGAVELLKIKDAKYLGFYNLWAIPANSIIKSTSDMITANLVYFPTFIPAMEFATDDLKTLIKRSLEWATGSAVGVADKNSIDLNTRVFPNPASGLVTVSFKGKATKVVLSSITGQKVAEFVPEGTKLTFETSKFNKGLYFITVGNETVKLIIE